MNKSELIARMTERFDGDRSTATAAVNGVLEEIEGSVARGERVSLTGFGTFERRERASRVGRNPRTGEAIRVGPSVVPVFRAGTGFRTLLGQAEGVSSRSGSAAEESSVPRAAGRSPGAAPAPSARTAVVDADAAPDEKRPGKKPDEKARGQEGEGKAGKSKAGKSKVGKSKVGKGEAEKGEAEKGEAGKGKGKTGKGKAEKGKAGKDKAGKDKAGKHRAEKSEAGRKAAKSRR